MLQGESWRIDFPLDLVCPACGTAPVTMRVVTRPFDTVDVEVSCGCGRRVNFGSRPAEYIQGGLLSPPANATSND